MSATIISPSSQAFTTSPSIGRQSLDIRDYVDEHGKPITSVPSVVSYDLLKTLCRRGAAQDPTISADGSIKFGNPGLVRAFRPYVVTVLEYGSEFQMVATRREIFLYAPPNYTTPGKLALSLWTRWFKPASQWDAFARPEYPMAGEAGIVDPCIGDDGYEDTWKFVRNKAHKCIGNPDRPIAFVCLDESVCTVGDTLQDGLIRTV